MGLCTLLFTDIGSGWFNRVVATDASDTGQGVVAAVADPTNVTSSEAAVDLVELVSVLHVVLRQVEE